MRTCGDILLELEVLLDELIDKHQLQWGDIISLVFSQLTIHRPDAQEKYLDNSSPILYYGPKEK